MQPRQLFLIRECDSSTFQTEAPVATVKKLITEIETVDQKLEPIHGPDFIEYFHDLKCVNIVTTTLDRNEIVTLDTQECDKQAPYESPPSEVIHNLAELIGSTSSNMEYEL